MNLTLYCNSFNDCLPIRSQCNQKTLICGSHFLSEDIRSQYKSSGYILDDDGENISELNPLLGDLTGLYWVWKNARDEFIGTNQYCRFYKDDQLTSLFPLNVNTLYVSNFRELSNNIWAQYEECHGKLGIQLLQKAIEMRSIPITQSMFDMMYHQYHISTCNSFFGHTKVFNVICSILFEIIDELYSGSKYIIEHVQYKIHPNRSPHEKRTLAFLAERILTMIYINREYYLGNINIVPVEFII